MTIVRSLVLLVLSVLVLIGQQPPSYYVDAVNGSDSNAGTSSAPWKTIQKAADTIEEGRAAIIRAGTYNERVVVKRSGRAGALLTFQAEGTVVMQGFTIYADYVRVSGFEITNSNISYADGTGVGVQGRNNEITNNYIHDLAFGQGVWLYGGPGRDSSTTSNNVVTGNRIVRARIAGIQVEGTNNVIEGNDISHTIKNPPGAPDREAADADGIRFFGSGHGIRRNYIHDITLTDAGNAGAHIDAFQTWGPFSNVIIEQNRIWQMESPSQGIIIEGMAQPVGNITIRNNIFMTSGTGYSPAVVAGDWGSVTNLSIVNNTIVALNGPAEFAVWLFPNVSSAVVKNNAIYDFGGNQPYIRVDTGASGLDIGFNSISKSNGLAPIGSAYPGDLWMVNPQFVDFAARDFRLQSASPLANAAVALSTVPDDFLGTLRPIASPDVGAFESH